MYLFVSVVFSRCYQRAREEVKKKKKKKETDARM
jgi:hypothetical protein